MKLIDQSYKIVNVSSGYPLDHIASCARTCYQSQDNSSIESDGKLVNRLIKSGHHAMLEFVSVTVKFITNRGVTHELVRHRLSSFAQESTRFVRYDGTMEFIRPVWWNAWGDQRRHNFMNALSTCERNYMMLLERGASPQEAREVLPNALKTEIVMLANFRQWIHIFKLRTSKAAHPQMRALMSGILGEFKECWPEFFSEVKK